MQASWRTDADKLTFIACVPCPRSSIITPGLQDSPDCMIGDVNLFLSEADEDPEGCIGELELMIAPKDARRQGYGRATILAFVRYNQRHLEDILKEYRGEKDKMQLLQLRVKSGGSNEKSLRLFESIGFMKVEQSPNYFGEFELVLEGFLGEERTTALLEKYSVDGYVELPYGKDNSTSGEKQSAASVLNTNVTKES